MKPYLKISFIIIIILVISYSAAYLFLQARGAAIVTDNLQKITGRQVGLDRLNIRPLFNLELSGLNIEGLVKAKRISVSPGLLYLLTGRIAVDRLIIEDPQFTYTRVSPAESAGIPAPKEPVQKTAQEPKAKVIPSLIINRLTIKNGIIKFDDRTVDPQPMVIILKNINFSLSNLYLAPVSSRADFSLKAKMPWQQGKEEGGLEADGWVNLFKNDMQASVKISDIDGIYFYPYYSKWVDLEKARIERAKLNFTSSIHSLDNNLTADCRLELTDLARRPRASDELQERAEKITDAVIEIFKALNQGNIVLDFTIRTKMNSPRFGFTDLKSAFENKLAEGIKSGKITAEDVLAVPVKIIEGTVKGATDITRAVIDGTFAVGSEFKKAVEGAFKKE